MITKYGYGTVSAITVVVFILIVIAIFTNNSILKYSLLVLGTGFLLFTLYFFRDPDRTPPAKQNVVVAPADGKVIILQKTFEDKFLKEEAWQLSIFMSPLNVHVNRIPISGKIEYLNYHKGDYLVAFHEKADKRNERNEIGITSKYGKILFTQVAGFVARRIVSTVSEGDSVRMGDRFGMIKFGSRSDVFVPASWNVMVKNGDNVTAGETILFEYPNEGN